MNIKVEYSRDEVDRIILERHEKTFGPPPAGEQWSCHGGYGDRTVENVSIPEPAEIIKPAPVDEVVCPPPHDQGGL